MTTNQLWNPYKGIAGWTEEVVPGSRCDCCCIKREKPSYVRIFHRKTDTYEWCIPCIFFLVRDGYRVINDTFYNLPE